MNLNLKDCTRFRCSIDKHKGQLIWKGRLGFFNSSKKQTKKFCTVRLEQKLKFQVRFFEELKTIKVPIKI